MTRNGKRERERERERERDDARKSNEARKSDGTGRVFRAKAKRSEKKRKSRVGEGAREGGEIEAVERRERKTEMEEVRQVEIGRASCRERV